MASPGKRTILDRLHAVNSVFLPSSPVADEDLLTGRSDHLFDLLEVTSTPGAHAAIYGERGVGKTSVAAVFANLARVKNCIVGRINCTIGEDFGRIWTNMADHILDIADGPATIDRETAFKAMEAFSYSQRPADVVRYLRRLSVANPIVLIFDEFDVLGDASTSESFANLMKAVSDLQINVHVVVVGVAEDIDALLEGHASVARGLVQIKMPRLSQDELEDVINRGAERLGLVFDPPLTEKIVHLSQGLPHYTHLLAQQASRLTILRDTHVAGLDMWRDILSASVSRCQQQVIDMYHQATASASKASMYRAVLEACVHAQKDVQGFFRPADVVGPLNKITGKNYQIRGFVRNLAGLAEADRGPVLETRTFADQRKRYRFTNPLLQPYILIRAARGED